MLAVVYNCLLKGSFLTINLPHMTSGRARAEEAISQE